MIRFLAAFLCILTSLLTAPPLHAGEPVSMDVRARTIENFRIGRSEQSFGALSFIGGLELTSPSRQFGGFSAFRFTKPGTDFFGVADTGYFYSGTILRDAQQRPSGFSKFEMQAISPDQGMDPRDKRSIDAEALAIKGGSVFVGFERNHRIAEYAFRPGAMGRPLRNLDPLIPLKELRVNRSFETLIASPDESAFQGALIVVTETSLNKQGDCFAAVLSGPKKGIFFVARTDEFDITDGAFLPDGDLILLERRFSMARGVAMRLRRIAADDVRPGQTVDGPTLMEADMAYQIDNMEGLDVWIDDQGATRIGLISDDNHSFLQRTLYLEFVLDK